MGQSTEELRREIERTRGELSGDLEAIGDRVSPKRMFERRTNRLRDFMSTGRERLFGRADDVRSSTGDLASSAGDALRDVPDRTREQVTGNPMAAGAVAFGVGFLAAVVFPGTRTEAHAAQRLAEPLQPVTDELTQGAKEMAHEVAATVQDAGREAAAEIKTSATERAEDLKSTVQEEKEAVQRPS